MAVDPMEMVARLEERAKAARSEGNATALGDAIHFEQSAACIRVLVEQNRRAGAPQAGAFLEAEALAEAWSDRPEIQRMVEVSTGVFAKWASAELLSRFRQQVMGVIQQAYIEGRSEAPGGSDA